MKEQNQTTSKNKLSRIFRKKWFFPAVYLTIAALLLTIVLWYQSLDNQVTDPIEEPDATSDLIQTQHNNEEDAQAVLDQQEVIHMPVAEEIQTEIVTKFYDHNAEDEDQENALILYNNRYHQSTGIDIVAEDGDSFEVLAALSGTVTETKEHPLLGNVVVLSHENDVVTYYASLGEVQVKAGEKVTQGDVLGTAGKNIFGKDNGNHVHFEIRKNGESVNPEVFFNQPVSKLDDYAEEGEADDSIEQPDDQQDDEDEENENNTEEA